MPFSDQNPLNKFVSMGNDETLRDEDAILRDHLDKEDLLEFERSHSIANSLFQQGDTNLLELENRTRDRVTCNPPVKVYVGKMPLSMNSNGLKNIFLKFGVSDIIDVSKPIRAVDGEHNFGFVTFSNAKAAGEAISRVNGAKPLHLKVNFARVDRSKQMTELERKLEGMKERFQQPPNTMEKVVSDEWEQEVEREHKMWTETTKFMEDFSSSDDDDDIPLSAIRTKIPTEDNTLDKANNNIEEEKPKIDLCGRCYKPESKFRCGRCSSEKYCSSACQSLDWPRHKLSCIPCSLGDKTVDKLVPKVKKTIIEDVSTSSSSSGINIETNKKIDHLRRVLHQNSKDSNYLPPVSTLETPTQPETLIMPKIHLEEDLPTRSISKENEVMELLELKGIWAILRFHQTDIRQPKVEALEKIGSDVKEGVLALVLDDEKLIRVVVDNVHDGSIGVHGIDTVYYNHYPDHSHLYQLPRSLSQVPVLAKTVKLPKDHQLTLVDIGKLFKVEILGESKGYDVVQLTSHQLASPKEMFSACESQESSTRLEEIGVVKLKVGKIQSVYIVHYESPREIYVTPDLKDLKRFQGYVYSTGASLDYDPAFTVNKGDMVLAKSFKDRYWYRAFIHELTEDDQATFYCPDFGFRQPKTKFSLMLIIS